MGKEGKRMKHTKTLLLALLLLLALALACGDPPAPEPVSCDQLEGMARFKPDAIERCGCPDPELVPGWYVIPECPAT